MNNLPTGIVKREIHSVYDYVYHNAEYTLLYNTNAHFRKSMDVLGMSNSLQDIISIIAQVCKSNEELQKQVTQIINQGGIQR